MEVLIRVVVTSHYFQINSNLPHRKSNELPGLESMTLDSFVFKKYLTNYQTILIPKLKHYKK